MAAGKRKSGRILILLALVLIFVLVAAAVLLRDQIFAPFTQQAQILPTQMPAQVLQQIVIVAQPIARGTVITEAMLGFIDYPQDRMYEGLFFTDMQNVINKRAKFDLEPGTPLTSSLITEGQTGSFASFQVPSGMVAISVPIDKLTSVAYALQPGDHVNVIGSIQLVDIDQEFQTVLPNALAIVQKSAQVGEAVAAMDLTLNITPSVLGRIYQDPSLANEYLYIIPSEAQRPRLVSQTIVQDAIVLWVGEFPAEEETATTAAVEATPVPEEGAAETIVRPDVITLVVTPQDSIAIDYLMKSDTDLTLVLRGAGDAQKPALQPVTLQYIMDQYNIPYPSKLPYGIYAPTVSTPAVAYPAQ
jgi:Flp pilus assembly protein CpaB